MTNINITTNPTGRSPENKYFFGDATSELCTERSKYCKVGNMDDYLSFAHQMLPSMITEYIYKKPLQFESANIRFQVYTNDERHEQFVKKHRCMEVDVQAQHIRGLIAGRRCLVCAAGGDVGLGGSVVPERVFGRRRVTLLGVFEHAH